MNIALSTTPLLTERVLKNQLQLFHQNETNMLMTKYEYLQQSSRN